jgi:hypothetical protein
MEPEHNTDIPQSEAMASQAETRVPTSAVAASAIRSFLFPQGKSPEHMAANTGGAEERRRGLLVNTARAGGITAMLAEVPGVSRRIPITTWESERDVNLLCLDRIRFESVPVIDGRVGTRRRAMNPQLAWEARRKHAPCTIPISPSSRVDCRYVRIDNEIEYVRRLWELTAPNPSAPLGMSVLPSFVRTGHSCLYVGPPLDGRPKTRNGNFPSVVVTPFPENGMLGTASMHCTCQASLLAREILAGSLKKSGKNRPTVDTVC